MRRARALAVPRPSRATPFLSATEQSWHRRARRQRQQARAILAIASARSVLAAHHGGGGAEIMPNKGKRGHEHRLDALQRQLSQAINEGKLRGGKGGGGGGGGSGLAKSSSPSATSWTCQACDFYNFEYRRRCLRCKRDGPAPAPGNWQKGKGSPAQQPQGPGGKSGGGDRLEWKGKAELEAKIRRLEARLEAQPKVAKPHGDDKALEGGGDDDDVELLEDDADEDSSHSDVANLPALQKTYEAMVAALGNEDTATKDLKARIEAARAKQRASKPILQQVQQAQRRAGRLEKQLEAAKKARADLEDKRSELMAQITLQDEKVAAQKEALEKSKKELGDLLEKAKEEQGTPGEEQKGSSNKSELSLEGAAEAWNRAKKAIECRVLGLPNAAQQTVGKQIQEQYAALESLLNQLPLPPAPPATVTVAGSVKEDGGTANGTPAAALQCDNAQPGNTVTGSIEEEADEDDQGMLDLDADTLQKLACALRSGDADLHAAGDGDGGDGGGASSGAGSNEPVLSAKQLHAARAILGKKIPVRKPGKPGKARGSKP